MVRRGNRVSKKDKRSQSFLFQKLGKRLWQFATGLLGSSGDLAIERLPLCSATGSGHMKGGEVMVLIFSGTTCLVEGKLQKLMRK